VVLDLALAEERAWFGAAENTAAEVAAYLDVIGGVTSGVVVDDGGVRGFAGLSQEGDTLLVVDVSLAEPPFAPLADWLTAHGARKIELFSGDAVRLAWFERHGWSYAYSAYDLRRPVGSLATPSWPDGVLVAAYRPGDDDTGVHRLVYVDAAWASVTGHTERPLDAWLDLIRLSHGWVARRGDRPVGWVLGRVFDDGRGWVMQIAVARDERRHGIGRALLLHAFGELVAMGATSLGLGVQAANDRAIGLYRSVGLEVTREWRIYEAPNPSR
jgi:ribosomal protein S18 acetylase RimI-like enzyme